MKSSKTYATKFEIFLFFFIQRTFSFLNGEFRIFGYHNQTQSLHNSFLSYPKLPNPNGYLPSL